MSTLQEDLRQVQIDLDNGISESGSNGGIRVMLCFRGGGVGNNSTYIINYNEQDNSVLVRDGKTGSNHIRHSVDSLLSLTRLNHFGAPFSEGAGKLQDVLFSDNGAGPNAGSLTPEERYPDGDLPRAVAPSMGGRPKQ